MILSELLWQINSTTGSSLWTYFFILFQLHFTTREKNISQITQIAKQIGISRNEWIVQAIEYVLDNMEEKEE